MIFKPLLTNKRELHFFGVLGIFLLVFLIISLVIGSRIERGSVSSPSKVVITDPFDSININAKAAYVYDIRTGNVLYAKNADARLPLASLTKVMTALVATELAPSYSTIVVTNAAIQADGDSGFKVGERWTLKNLIDFSLTTSSNDGAKAVALALGALENSNSSDENRENDFIQKMNVKAKELRMKNTFYYNETGLDESEEKGGAYGSAKDQAILFAYIMNHYPDIFEATRQSIARVASLDNTVHVAHNTDEIVSDIPGVKASKTGFTDIAGGNLVIAFDPELGRPIIVSVLGSTAEERFTDVDKLIKASLKKLSAENQN